MSSTHHFTEEERAELLSNPYTARVTEYKAVFTLAFKQFVMEHIDLPGMTAAKVFRLAGYSDSLFTPKARRYTIRAIRTEAASEKGLQEPSMPKPHHHRKNHSDAEFKELQERVSILEQQVNFLKKSQLLKMQDRAARPDNTS